MSNFQWVWRYSCLNVTHKKPYKRYEGKTNDLLIAFIDYVNDLNKLQQFKVSVQKSPPSTSMHFSTLLATVRVPLLRSSWRSCFMRAALFIMRATNSSLVFTLSLYTSLFIHPHRQKSDLYAPTSNSCISTPTENWTHVYMNLFTRNSPYYRRSQWPRGLRRRSAAAQLLRSCVRIPLGALMSVSCECCVLAGRDLSATS